jgi:hypothetical protein
MDDQLVQAGKLIRYYRLGKGLNLMGIGVPLSVSQTTVWRIESGQKNLTLDQVDTLDKRLRFKPEDKKFLVDAYDSWLREKAYGSK